MTKLTVALLFAGGLLMAQNPPAADQSQQTQTPKSQRLSANEREALRSQSPSVKTVSSHKKHARKHTNARVVKDKSTINAYKETNK